MELIMVTKDNYKEAIKIQKEIFPSENGTLNILASLDRETFIKNTKVEYIDDHIKYYLAKDNDNYIGITGLYYYNFDKDSAWIGWYGVLNEYRNKGLGKELLKETATLARNKGFKYLRLYTDYIENYNAVKLYESMGFIGEKYNIEKLEYDCRIYSLSLTDESVPLWNNRLLGLSHQSELDHMREEQINEIYNKYEELLNNN